jgi:hypothetical protein
MQAFDRCLDIKPNIKHLFAIDGFIGCNNKNTTFIDILNDTWASSISTSRNSNHLAIHIPPAFEYLYTKNRHPSIEGHKKIANWLLTHVDF